jgi:hypothetical protein
MEKKEGNEKRRPVLVLDTHRGIYWGYIVETLEGGNAVRLENARHCFYFNAVDGHEGVYGLAAAGPGKGSKIGPKVDMLIRDVSKVVECSKEAATRWESVAWGR